MSLGTTVTFTATPTAAGAYTSAGNVVTFTNTSMGASAYSWDFGDQSSSSAATPSHAYVGNGVYTVTLTAINGNCTDVISFDVTISVGVDELTGLSNVAIYPNPASDVINIDFVNNQNQVVELTLVDQFGRIVSNLNENNTGFIHNTINVNNLTNGVYFLNFTVGGYTKSERVVIR
jgi:PKD repeat protein